MAFIPMVCYGGMCYGWQREVLDWGIVAGSGVGGYFAGKAEPFFERPLIGGPGDRPYKEEQVPSSWLVVSNVAMVGLAGLLPNQDGWLNARSYRHVKGAAETATVSLLLKDLLKDIVGRPRPDYYNRLELGIDLDEARESWPSGHATHAANVVTYLTLYTWDEWRSQEPWALACKSGISVLLGGAATWVAYTRVADNRHYVGDVIAGSLLGAGTALFFYSYQQWWGAPDTLATTDLVGASTNLPPFSIGVRLSF